MVNTDTPVSPEKGKTTPSGKTDTPAQEPAGDPTTPDEKVAKLEARVEELANELARKEAVAKTAQKQARIEKVEKKRLKERLRQIRDGEIEVPPDDLEGATSIDKESRLEAKMGVQNLLLENPEYYKLLEQDPTLKTIIRKNPLALIEDYLDAEDAVEQIKEVLEDRVEELKAQPKAEEDIKKKGAPEFESGIAQPSGEPAPPPEEEKGTPGQPMDAVEASINSKIKFV